MQLWGIIHNTFNQLRKEFNMASLEEVKQAKTQLACTILKEIQTFENAYAIAVVGVYTDSSREMGLPAKTALVRVEVRL